MTAIAQLLKSDAGTDYRCVGHDVFVGDPVHLSLSLGRFTIADKPGARDICAHAVATDQVGIESQNFVVTDEARATFQKPGIGSWPARQNTRLDSLSATPDI